MKMRALSFFAGILLSLSLLLPQQAVAQSFPGTSTNCGVQGSPLKGSHLVNAQTGTTYTVVNGDCGKLVTTTNASSIAITLPQAGASSLFVSGWVGDFQNRGAGTATITPTTSTIDGAASLALTTGQGVRIFSNGSNYFTQRGVGGGGVTDGDKGDITVTSSGATWTIDSGTITTAKIVDANVTDAKLRNSGALSVIGRPANSSGVPADIATSADGDVLRRSGTTLGFGAIATAGITDAAVTSAKLRDSTALSVIGRTANSSGVPADIAAANDNEVLRRSGTAIGFGTVATGGIADAAVTYAKIQNLGALALMGRSANSSGVGADIAASAGSSCAFRESGSAIACGTLATAAYANSSVTYAKIQDISATQRLLGRNSASAGVTEEVTATQALDWIGSTQGQILYRNGTVWTVLAPGTSGQVLQSGGAAANPSWLTVTGTGTVTNVATGCGLTGGAITTTGTIKESHAVNAQTGTTYTVLDSDCGKLVTTTNAAAIAITLPQAGGGGSFVSGWLADFQNRGAGTATITPTTSTIDGAASLALTTSQGVTLYSDGTNYFTQRGMGSGGAGVSDGDKGDITVSSSGAVWTIDASTISNAKLRDSAGLSVIGRSTNSTGAVADITAANDNEVLRRSGTAVGFGTLATASIADTAITYAKIQDVAALSVVGRSANTSGVSAAITAANDNEVLRRSGTAIGFGTVATGGITASAVTYAKIQDISATQRLLGRNTAGAGATEEVTATQTLDWIGATRGQVLYRGASGWSALSPGTSGQVLQSGGAGADPSWLTASGTGTVTSVATACGITGGAITISGTVTGSHAVNAQTGTTYTYLDGDCGKIVTHTNASSIAGTLPQAGAGSAFIAGWSADVQNRGAGTLTITPTTSTIDGAANLTLATGQGVRIFSDGTNYFTQRGRGNSGTVTSVATGCGLSGGPVTTTGTILENHIVINQTLTTYTVLDSGCGKLISNSNASSIAITLPQAGASSLFVSGWSVDVHNRGAGTVTITPTTSTIDGAASLALTTGQGVRIFSDGGDYYTQRGVGGGVSDGDKGDITVSSSGATWTIDSGTITTAKIIDANVTDAKLRNSGALSVIGRSANSSGVPADIATSADGDVLRRSGTTLGFGAIATAGITDANVTNAKLANMANATFKCRTTAGTGVPEDCTATQSTALLNAMVGDSGSGGTKGLVPVPATGDATKFLKGNGTWAAATGSIDVQTFTASGTWTKPAAGSMVLVEAWGGGGSGGKGASNAPEGGGGGGACNYRWMPIASLGATETITIGAGGAAQTVASTAGNAGANTTVGSLLTAYGGGAGGQNAAGGGGGGGGGAMSAGAAGSGSTGGAGGGPGGAAGGTSDGPGLSSSGAAGGSGAGGGAVAGIGGDSYYGGGGGGSGRDGAGSAAANAGGNSFCGGGGGGGGADSVAGGNGGTSVNGGAGSAGTIDANASSDGTQPGGGSGGTEGGNSGKGGDGKVRVTTF